MLNVDRTIISQYANSPTLRAIIDSLNDCIDPRTDLSAFYEAVWNVDTAYGYGLDVWGRIVGVSRLLRIPNNSDVFGFINASMPPDWKPFNSGVFNPGASPASQTYILDDATYRVLILAKALANISSVTASGINSVLNLLFPGRGKCYVTDGNNMSMQYVFEFQLTVAEYAILSESGVLPHPAGVHYSVLVIPGLSTTLGFLGQPGLQGFNHGSFYTRD